MEMKSPISQKGSDALRTDNSGNLVAIECVGNLKTKQPIIDYED